MTASYVYKRNTADKIVYKRHTDLLKFLAAGRADALICDKCKLCGLTNSIVDGFRFLKKDAYKYLRFEVL